MGESIHITISEFLSPNLFFGYEVTDEYHLDDKINLFYKSFHEFFYFDNLPKIGTVCAARYIPDKNWYRARVLNCDLQFKSVDLYFLDYGNIERSVPIKEIRKLEGTFSTQFHSHLDQSNKHCQAALFGYIGVKPSCNYFQNEESITKLIVNQSFNFQVVDLPIASSKVKNHRLVNIPLFLVQNDSFSKSSSKLSNWIIKELSWEECSFNDSLEVIIQSLCKINYNIFNAHIMIPRYLKSHQRSKKQESQSNHKGIVVNICDSNHLEDENKDTDDNEKDMDMSDFSEKSQNNFSECGDFDENDENLRSKENEGESLCHINPLNNSENECSKDQLDDSEEELSDTLCSIISWKMSSILVESKIKEMAWHFPLPSESIFRAVVTDVDDKLGFHINICSLEVAKSFKSLERSLHRHFLLCNNSMLKDFVSEIDLVPGTICLCNRVSTYNRCVIVGQQRLDGKYNCRFMDYGNMIPVDKAEIIPISDQFCKLPPLAVECILSGFGDGCENLVLLVEKFKQLLLECEYEVLVSICYMDRRINLMHVDDKIIVSQPIPMELFIARSGPNQSNSIFSVNAMLHELNEENIKKIETEELEPMSVSQDELILSLSKDLEAIESSDYSSDELNENNLGSKKDMYISNNLHDQTEMPHPLEKKPICEYYLSKGKCLKGSTCADCHVMDSDSFHDDKEVNGELDKTDLDAMRDIYISHKLHDQTEMPHPFDKKPVCEYYRSKGRCFKGSKCTDRHVMDSDCSDDDDGLNNEFKWIESAVYLTSSFQRYLRVGSTIGLRVSAIYSAGIFYAYLTHGISGFDADGVHFCHSDDDSDDNNTDNRVGLNFATIQEMEDSLQDFMAYKYRSFNNDVELTPNTLVAVSLEGKIQRGSVTGLVSHNRYQIFLVDYGISVEVNLSNLFLLPKEYVASFKQQCFMFKLSGVRVQTESKSQLFADWFLNKVNKRILHAKVVDTDDDGLNFVELYDFIADTACPSINSLACQDLDL